MQKTILLQSAGILDEEAKCTLKQNVYIKDGKIFKIVAENEDDLLWQMRRSTAANTL